MRFRTLFGVLAGLCIVALLTGPVAAENYIERDTVEVSVDEARWTRALRHTNDTAQSIRSHIDEDHGDHDGLVTVAEVHQYERDHIIWFNETTADCFDDVDFIRIGGESTGGSIVETQRVVGAHGENRTASDVRILTTLTMRFPKTNASAAWVNVTFQGGYVSAASEDCYTVKENHNATLGTAFSHTSWEFFIFADNYEGFFNEVVPVGSTIHALPGYTIDRQSATPPSIQSNWDGRGWSESSTAAPLHQETVHFRVVRGYFPNAGPTTTTASPTGQQLILIVAALGGLLGIALVWSNEAFRVWIVRMLIIAGFSRLQEDDVLLHKRREEILQRVREEPGLHFSKLGRLTEIPNGPLVHHLRILSERGLLVSGRDAGKVRYYPRQPGAVFLVPRTERQLMLLDRVQHFPGASQRDLARALGWSRLAVHRSAKALVAGGDLRLEHDGRHRRYFPGERAKIHSVHLNTGHGTRTRV